MKPKGVKHLSHTPLLFCFKCHLKSRGSLLSVSPLLPRARSGLDRSDQCYLLVSLAWQLYLNWLCVD